MPKICADLECPTIGNCKCEGCVEEDADACILCPEHGCLRYPVEKWSYNFTEDGLWDNEVFATGEEAYEAGKAAALEEGYDIFYIGQLVPITISRNAVIDVDDILDAVSQQLDDEYGGDFDPGEQWYEAITSDDKLTLEEILNVAFHEWLQKTNNQPKTLTVIDIDEYCKMDTEDWGQKLSSQKAKQLSEKLVEEMLNSEG